MNVIEQLNPNWAVYPAVISGLLQAAEGLGADRHALLIGADIAEHRLAEPRKCIPTRQLFRLYQLAEQHTGVADIGLYCGRIAYVCGLNLQLYMTTICSSFRDYLNLIPSVLKIQGDIGEIRVRSESSLIRLEWHPLCVATDRSRYLADSALAMSALIVDSLCVQPIRPLKACLSYAEPADTALLRTLFNCELTFEQPHSCLYFERAALDFPIAQLDQRLEQGLIAASVRHLFDGDAAGDCFLAEVRASIARQLPTGEMTVDSVAADLNLSRRTLQRRLAQRDTQFLLVLQSIRDELARRYLHDKRLAITEIAFLLGYSDTGSFSSAFRSWHGLSPSEYRQQ